MKEKCDLKPEFYENNVESIISPVEKAEAMTAKNTVTSILRLMLIDAIK
jgi:hypothetical protein